MIADLKDKMSAIEKHSDFIDKFILGTLTENEQNDFDNLMELHPEIKEEVQFRKQLHDGFESVEVENLRTRLGKIKEEIIQTDEPEATNTEQKNALWKILLIAALALLLGLLAFRYLQAPKQEIKKSQFASYYQPYLMDSGIRGANEQSVQNLYQAYSKGEYAESISLLNEIMKTDDAIKWKLYRGISLFETNKSTEAIADFQTVIDSENYLWEDHGKWYLSLAHLKAEQVDKTTLLLEELASDPDADHHKEAIDLLSTLN